jgi:hypothetical protein
LLVRHFERLRYFAIFHRPRGHRWNLDRCRDGGPLRSERERWSRQRRGQIVLR